jgi:DNA-binding MarR family transcriptional regulator
MPEPTSPDPPLGELKRMPPLLRRAWYSLNQAFRQRTAHLRLTPDQFSILRWLSEGDPAGLTQRQITALMASDPNTITSTITRMEKAGLLVRRPHESDRRAHRVKLLPKGKRTFVSAKRIALELQNQILSVLPEERRDGFLRDLEAIAGGCAAALEQTLRAPGGAATESDNPPPIES